MGGVAFAIGLGALVGACVAIMLLAGWLFYILVGAWHSLIDGWHWLRAWWWLMSNPVPRRRYRGGAWWRRIFS